MRRSSPPALLLALLLPLAGCTDDAGSSQPAVAPSVKPTAAGPASSRLCGASDRVGAVSVRRRLTSGRRLGFDTPATTDVRRVGDVRRLARAVCASPAMAPGIRSCPLDTGLVYQLTFAVDGTSFDPVTLHLAGCPAITGLGAGRRLGAPVVRALSRALDVPRTQLYGSL